MNSAPPSDAVLLRRAVPGDSRAICRLYDRAYSTDQVAARDQYPFPQVLEPGWVAQAVAGGSIVWVVAEAEGQLVGSTAAVRNIGGPLDRIAEVFGIVVSHEAKKKRIATRLLEYLCSEVGDEAEFILCEARTAEPGGWKVARNCGFRPVGFEPFAHVMPIGFESMVLTARVPGGAWSPAVVPPRLSPDALTLATIVTENGRHRRFREDRGPSSSSRRNDPPPLSGVASPDEAMEVRRDDEAGHRILERWREARNYRSDVICLHPLEGEDRERRRFERPYFLGLRDGRIVGCARVAWDRTDRRARILEMCAEEAGFQGGMLAGTRLELSRMAGDGPLVVIVNVRADARPFQAAMPKARFFPSAYLPGFLAAQGGRCDAVQFTHLKDCRMDGGLDYVSGIDWPGARLLIDRVLESGPSNR